MMLQHYISGPQRSPNLVVFLQGWPDTCAIWKDKLPLAQLAECRLLLINIPNHGKQVSPWGLEFRQLIQRLKQTIDPYLAQKNILVCHDWGCFYTYMLDAKYPSLFRRIIAIDISPFINPSTPKELAFMCGYQWTLILAFLLGRCGGTAITKWLSKIFKHKPTYMNQIWHGMNFPYYYLWKNWIMGRLGMAQPYIKKDYKPSVPVTYIYGTNKPLHFHTERWLELVKEKGEVIPLKAGHWVMDRHGQRIVQQIKTAL